MSDGVIIQSGIGPVTIKGPSGTTMIVSQTGAPGPSGAAPVVTAVASVAITAGLALAVSRATGQFLLADNGYKPNAFVAGLAVQTIAAGFAVDAKAGIVTLPDWTAIVGAAALQPGMIYFLGTAGRLTIAPPAYPASLTAVGLAISTTTMEVNPHPPLQL